MHSLESSLQHHHTLKPNQNNPSREERVFGVDFFICSLSNSASCTCAKSDCYRVSHSCSCIYQKNPPKLNFEGMLSSCEKNVKPKVLMSMLLNSGYFLPRTTRLMYKKNYCHF